MKEQTDHLQVTADRKHFCKKQNHRTVTNSQRSLFFLASSFSFSDLDMLYLLEKTDSVMLRFCGKINREAEIQ